MKGRKKGGGKKERRGKKEGEKRKERGKKRGKKRRGEKKKGEGKKEEVKKKLPWDGMNHNLSLCSPQALPSIATTSMEV